MSARVAPSAPPHTHTSMQSTAGAVVPVGQISGVAVVAGASGGGGVWVLHRADRIWGADTFDAENRITEKDPIQAPTVLQVRQAPAGWGGAGHWGLGRRDWDLGGGPGRWGGGSWLAGGG